MFAAEEEAVIGAAVPLPLGGKIKPQHGWVEVPDGGHVHEETACEVVGRLLAAWAMGGWANLDVSRA